MTVRTLTTQKRLFEVRAVPPQHEGAEIHAPSGDLLNLLADPLRSTVLAGLTEADAH